MKAHLGVDSRSKLIRAVVAMQAYSADSTVLPDLLHGKERFGYDQLSRPARGDPPARNDGAGLTNRRYRHAASWMRSNWRKSDRVQSAGQG
jgi:transposase, IS5 family